MPMPVELTAVEARIIGCLMEKAITTPDQYPLSLNALTNACNQKSNREPVMDLDENSVQQVVDGLVRKHLVMETLQVPRPQSIPSDRVERLELQVADLRKELDELKKKLNY